MKVFKDIATKGKSTMEWYIGFNSPENFFQILLKKSNIDTI